MIGLLFSAGCTTKIIKPVTVDHKIETICINNNPAVFNEFLEILKIEFSYYGIKTKIFNNNGFINEWPDTVSRQCDYILTYVAKRSWDLTLFCRSIELHVYHRKTEIASVVWSVANSLNLNKYNSTGNKIRKILKELLINYSYVNYPQPLDF